MPPKSSLTRRSSAKSWKPPKSSLTAKVKTVTKPPRSSVGARADSQFPFGTAVGPGTRHGGGVAALDVVRVVLAWVSGAVPAERADAVSAERADAMRRRGWVSRVWLYFSSEGLFLIRRGTGICGSGV